MNTYSKFCPNVWLAKCDSQHAKGEVVNLTTKHGKENEVQIWNLIYEKDGFFFYSFTRTDGFNSQEHARAKAEYFWGMADKIDLSMPESIEFYAHKLELAKEYHDGLKSGKYQKQHCYSVAYANKAVNEAKKNYDLAVRLWGDKEGGDK